MRSRGDRSTLYQDDNARPTGTHLPRVSASKMERSCDLVGPNKATTTTPESHCTVSEA
jgi:hypothetical protein